MSLSRLMRVDNALITAGFGALTVAVGLLATSRLDSNQAQNLWLGALCLLLIPSALGNRGTKSDGNLVDPDCIQPGNCVRRIRRPNRSHRFTHSVHDRDSACHSTMAGRARMARTRKRHSASRVPVFGYDLGGFWHASWNRGRGSRTQRHRMRVSLGGLGNPKIRVEVGCALPLCSVTCIDGNVAWRGTVFGPPARFS